MQTVEKFAANLERGGVRLWAEDGRLRVSGPPDALTPAVREELQRRKPELLALLSSLAALEKIVRVSRHEPPPLSFAQQRLWFLNQLEGGFAYNLPAAFCLEGPLDVGALECAVNEIVCRHELLRTVYPDGRRIAVLSPEEAKISLSVMNPNDSSADFIRRWVEEEATRPFDLIHGPVWRVRLLRLAPDVHVLTVVQHHIASDGWSIGIIARELSELYAAFKENRPSPLPELPIQYADFAAWQRRFLSGANLERLLNFWRQRLDGADPVLELPADRPRPVRQSFQGAQIAVQYPSALTRKLKALAREPGTTLFMALSAGFAALLARYTGRDDLLLGTPMAGRTRPEVEGLPGPFVNILPLRFDLSGKPSFRELIRQTRLAAPALYEHQELPFEKLVEQLQPARDLSRNPLVQVMFALHNTPGHAPVPTLELSGLRVTPQPFEHGTVRMDLEAHFWEIAGELHGRWVYNRALFDAATVRRLGAHFGVLLEYLAEHPDEPTTAAALLTPAERDEFAAWNETAAPYSAEKDLTCLIEEHARKQPDKTAVVCGHERLTYGEMNEQAERLARRLRALDCGPDWPIGLCLERSVAWLTAMLGILKAGGAYVPLDPTYPQERLAHIIADAGMKIIVAHQPTEKALPAHSAAVVWFDALEPSPAEVIRSKPAVASSSRDLAYVIFTSGSTGRPKGAALERHSVVNLVECLRVPLGYSPDDVFLQFHSFAFDFSVWEIFSALTLGATLVVAPHEVSRSPAALYDLLCAEGVTVLGLTPTALRQLAAERERRGSKPNWRVRLVGVGGEACPKTLPALLRDWGVPLVNFYGPTEATVWATMDFLDPQAPPEAPLAIGRPLPNYETYVLDRCGLPQPVGVPGELYLGGVGLARGYWNRPDLTAERFVPHPFHPDRRLYKTGDRARFLPDGRLEFFGRLDDQVKLRGHRIELGDIETTLLTHPDVADAAVALREDRPGDQRLAAYCCAKKGCRLEVEALRAWLQNKLPGYMVPAVFVFLENLPLSANGKINRRALPVPQSVGGTREMTPPRNSVEKQLADIWREVLGMETVGVHDNFFELGGHSLLMIQIQDGIRRVWNRELSVVSFFKHPTVAEQATLLQGETGADDAPSFARSRAARQIAAARQAVQLRGSEKDHE